jgi:hypothetical protein
LQPYVDLALEVFGPRRMMFGSDWPVCLLAGSYEQVLEAAQTMLAGLSEEIDAESLRRMQLIFIGSRAANMECGGLTPLPI